MNKLMGKNIITLSGPIIFLIETSALVFKRNVTVILVVVFFLFVQHLLNLIQTTCNTNNILWSSRTLGNVI